MLTEFYYRVRLRFMSDTDLGIELGSALILGQRWAQRAIASEYRRRS